MKKVISVLLILMMLVGTYPLSSVLAAPDPQSPQEFQGASVPGARTIAYHDGYIYVAQRDPGGVYRIDIQTGTVSKVFDRPYLMSVALNQAGDIFYTTDSSGMVRKLAKSNLTNLPLSATTVNSVSTNYFNTGFSFVYGIAFDDRDNLYFADASGAGTKSIYKWTQGQSSASVVTSNLSSPIYGFAVSPDGVIYGAGSDSNLYTINVENGQVTKKSASPISGLNGVTFLPDGQAILTRGNSIALAPQYNAGPDTQKPVITLNGAAQISLKYGAVFTDPGVTVTDNVDTGLTAKVTYTKDNISVPGINTNAAGTYIIHYNAADAAGNQAAEVTRTVVVNEPVRVTGISLNPATQTFTVGGDFAAMNATISPTDAANKNVVWTSSNPAVATVVNGYVSGESPGTSTITVTTRDGGFTASSVVTVNAPDPGQTPYVNDARAIAYHDGYIYVAQRGLGGIYRINIHTGALTKVLIQQTVMAVALNQNGDLFYTTDGSRMVKKIAKSDLTNLPITSEAAGTVSSDYYNTGFSYVYGLAFDANDHLFFTDYMTRGIYTLPNGQTSATPVITNFSTPLSGITVSPKGVIYGVGEDAHLYAVNKDGGPVTKKSTTPLWGICGIAYQPNGKAFLSRSSNIAPAPEFDEEPVPDTGKPVIILNGAAQITLKYGTVFTDPGVNVTDNVDTGLTAQVTYTKDDVSVSGIDTNVPGTYVIHYNATDAAGNHAATVTRTVIVKEQTRNLASGAAVSVSTATYSGGITNLTDDSIGTGWSGQASDSPWKIKLDMGPGANYNDIVIVGSKALSSYQVTFSDDPDGPFEEIPGAAYPAAVEHTEGRYNGYTTETVSLPRTISKRYVQITLIPSEALTIQEIEAYDEIRTPEPVHPNSVTLNAATLTLTADGQSSTLIATVSPEDAVNKNVIWTSSNPVVATVENGVVTPVSAGTATITVTTEDGGFTASSVITVIAAVPDVVQVTGVTLDAATKTLTAGGQNVTLKATVSPADATNNNVVWTSSNPAVAAVENGVVTPVSAGTATITVTTVDGGFTVSSLITVNAANSDSGTSTGNGNVGTPNQPEKLPVVVDGGPNNTLSSVTILRTTGEDGNKQDEITFWPDNAQNTIKKLQAAGLHTARILIPDSKDEVSQTTLNLPEGTIQQLREGQIDLEVHTPNASIIVPNSSLSGIANDIYFRILPIKNESERLQVEARAKQEQVVKNALGKGGIAIVGIPVTIETNMPSRAVELKLPLHNSDIPGSVQAREQWLANLAVFIEHSDGERVLAKPKLEATSTGQWNLVFIVSKFSTFTIVNIDNYSTYLGQQNSFINGYPDGTFKPNQGVSRAEMAAMLARIGAGDRGSASAASYTDVAASYWAYSFITQIQEAGLMKGYGNSRFAPDTMITRAEMAAIVSRWLQLTGAGSSDAGDIQGHWAEQDIRRVSEAGIMKGMQDGSFQPNARLSRAEAVVIFNRMLHRDPVSAATTSSWSDVPSTHWAFGDIESASKDHK